MLHRTFKDCFCDKRLDARGNQILSQLMRSAASSVRQISKTSKEEKGFYRFLENRDTTIEKIIEGMSSRCAQSVKGKTVICIQDTTEENLYSHKGRLKLDESIGVTNASKNGLGFMVHPSFVIGAEDSFPYGFCHVHIYNRELERLPKEQRNAHRYKQLPIEGKESNKWLSSSLATKAVLEEAAMKIIVQDREGDIFEQYARIPDATTHLLIRAKSDRKLLNGTHLFEAVLSSPLQGEYVFTVQGDKRKDRSKREATMEVRYLEVELKNSSRTAKGIPQTVKLYCVEAREKNPPAGKDGVCWRLLTSCPVNNLGDALMIIEWYSWRWMIEEVFRLLKKEGFDVEASELESGTSIKKLTLLLLEAIVKIFQMRIAYGLDDEAAGLEVPMAAISFEKEEIECMEKQCVQLEGKTEKQKNPYRQKTLKWCTWVIARLGGWKGYGSERQPGLTTLWIGLEKFYNIFEGWKLFKMAT